MKKIILFLILAIPFLLEAQELPTSQSEPKYIGRIVFVDGDRNVDLEQQKSSTKSQAGASVYLTGIGKVKGTNNINGVSSPVRINQAEEYHFLVRVPDNNVDPFQLLNIFKLEQKIKKTEDKSYRYIETANAATFSGASSMDILFIDFDAVKFGESSFLITIAEQLEPAEYAMTLEGSRDLFNLFGIDE
jgi:hypothetical protein